MNNEELKKKIVEIINDGIIHGEDNFGVPTSKTIENIADALVEAGLLFGESYSHTATFNMALLDRINELERWLGEAEHRAEVAERAVYNLAYGEWQREGARRAICEKYAPSTARDYLDRAEKELAEENDGKKEV